MNKHTPGPWHTGGNGLIVFGPDGYAVANATVFHGRQEEGASFANAALIAAAPNLLNALERVIRGDIDAIDNARAVIAKARGNHV